MHGLWKEEEWKVSHKNEEGEPLPGETAEKRGGTAEERPRGMTLRFQQPRPPQTGEIEKYPLLLPETAGLVRGSEAQAVQDGACSIKARDFLYERIAYETGRIYPKR